MVHRELGGRESLLAVRAQPLTQFLLPPLRLAQFAGFRLFAFLVFGGSGFVPIGHAPDLAQRPVDGKPPLAEEKRE